MGLTPAKQPNGVTIVGEWAAPRTLPTPSTCRDGEARKNLVGSIVVSRVNGIQSLGIRQSITGDISSRRPVAPESHGSVNAWED